MGRSNFTVSLPGRENDEEDATAKQISYIRHLLRECEVSGFPESDLEGLGKWQASVLIDSLKQLRDGDIEGSRSVARARNNPGWSLMLVGWAVAIAVIWLILRFV